MPAKKTKPAAKKPAAKPAKKAPSKPAGKPKSKPSPVKKAPSKPAAKPKSKPAPAKKPAPKKSAPKPVKKAPAKPAPKKAAPKPVAKKSVPAKKAAPSKKAAPAKKAAPTKKAPAAKAVKAAPKAAAKKVEAAAAPVKPAKAPKASKSSKSAQPDVSHLSKPRSAAAPTARANRSRDEEEGATIELAKGPVKMTPFLKRQKQRLIELRDAYMDAIEGVANETIRGGADASAFGMHQADAGSDAYDRDFALSLLGKEQDALYEINQALKRIETGTYGLCEGTGGKIPEERLEAMPFARFTVAWQEKIEQQNRHGGWNRPVHSLFGLDDPGDSSDDDKDDDEAPASSRGKNNNSESLDFNKE